MTFLLSFRLPFERVVYLYLYRQSYGYNRQTCFTGLKPIIEWSQLSKNVVRRVLDSLERKQHIKRIGRVNEKDIKGTSYKIYLPCEIPGLTSDTVFTSSRTTHIPQCNTAPSNDTVSRYDTVSFQVTVSLSATVFLFATVSP